mgnify:CR=1 FL=1
MKEIFETVFISGLSGFLAALMFYFIIPALIKKYAHKFDPDSLKRADEYIDELILMKKRFDFDKKNEDIIEKILKYADYAVTAARQELDGEDGPLKKAYAIELARTMLAGYKDSNGKDKKLTHEEEVIIKGMIETAIDTKKDPSERERKTRAKKDKKMEKRIAKELASKDLECMEDAIKGESK